MDGGERVGMFIVTIRSAGWADAQWIARVTATTDVQRTGPRAMRRHSPTVSDSQLVSSLLEWLNEFATD